MAGVGRFWNLEFGIWNGRPRERVVAAVEATEAASRLLEYGTAVVAGLGRAGGDVLPEEDAG